MAIYKYLAPERIQVLEDATLRATQANALNDPFELKPFFKKIMDKADLEKKIREETFFEREIKDAYMKQPAALRAKLPWSKLQALSKQHGFKLQMQAFLGKEIDNIVGNQLPNLTDQLRTFMHEKLGNSVGIVSFSEVQDEALMWAHYANDHKGFVLEFDDSDEFFDRRRGVNDEFFHLRPVDYQDESPAYSKITDLDGTKLLCGKQSRWSYERERRILIPVDPRSFQGSGEPVHLISFPRRAVRSVILGQRANDSLVADVKRILSCKPDYEHVQLLKARADLSSGTIAVEALHG